MGQLPPAFLLKSAMCLPDSGKTPADTSFFSFLFFSFQVSILSLDIFTVHFNSSIYLI